MGPSETCIGFLRSGAGALAREISRPPRLHVTSSTHICGICCSIGKQILMSSAERVCASWCIGARQKHQHLVLTLISFRLAGIAGSKHIAGSTSNKPSGESKEATDISFADRVSLIGIMLQWVWIAAVTSFGHTGRNGSVDAVFASRAHSLNNPLIGVGVCKSANAQAA